MRLWLFIVAVLLAGNVGIYLNRDRFDYRQYLSYNDLYAQESGFSIQRFEHRGKGALAVIGKHDSAVLLQLTEGTHGYTIFLPPDSLKMVAEYLPLASGGKGAVAIYDINAGLERPPVRRNWLTAIDAQELSKARRLLHDSVLTRGEKTTEQKVAAISIFLHHRIFASRGQPSAAVLKMSPLKMYAAACKGGKIWCSNYAKIFDLFARAAGIQSQVVGMKQDMPGVAGPEHTFNEYYDEERRAYTITDLTFNVVSAEAATGKKLNAVDFKNADPEDSSIRILQVEDDTLKNRPYAAAESLMHAFYGREKDLYFFFRSVGEQYGTAARRLKTYLVPRPWYGIYSDVRKQNDALFHLKQGMVALLMMSIACIGIAYFMERRKRADRRSDIRPAKSG